MLKVAAVIPCHNEEKNIGNVVETAKALVDVVIVVDDHSTDSTISEAEKAGAQVISNSSSKKGVGITTMLGIREASKGLAKIIVTLDGDGQHQPREIPDLIRPILDNRADLVVGTRMLQVGSMPFYRRLGNNIINWAFNFSSSHKVSDSMCGFRAYHADLLSRLEVKERGFEYVPEILLKARLAAARITEVPIVCYYHESFRMNSTMEPIEQGLRMVLSIIKWRVWLAARKSKPLVLLRKG
jgi:glycosyltransferase involved in cell wall biosynthesis